MATEIKLSAPTGLSLYCMVRSVTSQVWSVAEGMLVNPVIANWADYAIPMTETSPRTYVADFPTGITTPNLYNLFGYACGGASPASSDGIPVTSGYVDWNGSGVVQNATIKLSNGVTTGVAIKTPTPVNGPTVHTRDEATVPTGDARTIPTPTAGPSIRTSGRRLEVEPPTDLSARAIGNGGITIKTNGRPYGGI